jgi:hypothetical protein
VTLASYPGHSVWRTCYRLPLCVALLPLSDTVHVLILHFLGLQRSVTCGSSLCPICINQSSVVLSQNQYHDYRRIPTCTWACYALITPMSSTFVTHHDFQSPLRPLLNDPMAPHRNSPDSASSSYFAPRPRIDVIPNQMPSMVVCALLNGDAHSLFRFPDESFRSEIPTHLDDLLPGNHQAIAIVMPRRLKQAD